MRNSASKGGLRVLVVLALAVCAAALLAGGAGAVSGAGFTTVDEAVDGTGHCANGNPGVNCNMYDGKEFVWLNGGPAANGLGPDGDYFFAVVSPGGQPNPNDGGAKNLSDDFDTYTNRTFSVTGGEVSGYLGTHALDSGVPGTNPDGNPPFIRLFPYSDTTNQGHVYIMAICSLGGGYPVDPRDCKYDAFKVKEAEQPVQVEACFSGMKYRDDNKNGQLDPSEVGLGGWKVEIDGTVQATTDVNGDWSFCVPSHDPSTGTTAYVINEVQQDGWEQTGNTVDQSIAAGGATVALASFVYTVTAPNDAVSTADGLNFGNIAQGDVSGSKYYDANANGKRDVGEVGIAGWKIKQGGDASATIYTDASGNFSRTLDPGDYTFAESVATGWIQTGNTINQSATTGGASVTLVSKAYSVSIPDDQPSTVTGLNFGNVCTGAGGGLTIGFWSNKNGQTAMNDGGTLAPELALLVGLNLRNANGSNFDPTTYNQYKTWLLNALATNMAYMLSAQLSGMELNVEAGFVNGNSLIYAPGTTSANGAGFATVNAVMAEANAELGLHGYTVALSAVRTYQEALKNALDKANNNLNFLQAGPGSCPSLVFP
jgi:hypothetical protein